MVREAKRATVRSDRDFRRIVDDVKRDRQPRIIEKSGETLAAVVSLEDLDRVLQRDPTPEDIEVSLEAIGAWRDVDTERLKQDIYEGRDRGTRPISRPV